MQATIDITRGLLSGKTIELKPGGELLVGRLPDCDLALTDDLTISRHHCRFAFAPPRLILTNLSANGTRLNGEWTNEADLKDGDEVKIGAETVLRLSVTASAETHDTDEGAFPSVDQAVVKTFELSTDDTGATRPPREGFDETPVDETFTGVPCYVAVLHGPLAGKMFAVKQSRPLLVGRVAECGLCIERDPAISRRHCQIDFVPPDCFLTNMSANGSSVNGKSVDESKLTDGDEIEIGTNTVLQVHIDPSLLADGDGAEGVATDDLIEITKQECPSGLVLVASTVEAASLSLLTLRLSRGYNLFTVVDLGKAGVPLPEDIVEPRYLLDWMTPEAAAQVSPVITSPSESMGFASVLEEAWGGDAAVVFFSNQNPDQVHQHLRSLATYNPATGQQMRNDSLFAYWWPSLLKKILEHSPKDLTDHIMTGVDAVLLEDIDTDGWQMFATAEFTQHMESLECVKVMETV